QSEITAIEPSRRDDFREEIDGERAPGGKRHRSVAFGTLVRRAESMRRPRQLSRYARCSQITQTCEPRCSPGHSCGDDTRAASRREVPNGAKCRTARSAK